MVGSVRLVVGIRSLIALALVLLAQGRSLAQADINNGLVRMGVNPNGSLGLNPAINAPLASAGPAPVNYVTLRYMPTNGEADSGGIMEERWGVADTISATFGGSLGGGSTNLVPVSFTSTANSAVAVVTAAGILEVTHDYYPSSHSNAYEILLTIRNVSAAAVNVQYRRAFQWDIEPTAFSEFITLQGSAQPGVLSLTDRGNSNLNPLNAPVGTNGDVVNVGPGPTFTGFTLTLDLGALAPGATTVNRLYYGATADRASAAAAIATLGLNIYAIGHPDTLPLNSGTPNTFFFGFVPGGPIVVPPPPPPPPPAPVPVPLPTGKPDGTYAGSNGPAFAFSVGEGTFGFGRSMTKAGFNAPALAGPFVNPKDARFVTVINASQGPRVGQAESSSNDGISGFALSILVGLGIGLAGLVSKAVGSRLIWA